jgi:hypothetical protein
MATKQINIVIKTAKKQQSTQTEKQILYEAQQMQAMKI